MDPYRGRRLRPDCQHETVPLAVQRPVPAGASIAVSADYPMLDKLQDGLSEGTVQFTGQRNGGLRLDGHKAIRRCCDENVIDRRLSLEPDPCRRRDSKQEAGI